MTTDNKNLEDLTNIGPTLAKKLYAIGIRSLSDLGKQGPVATYIKLCQSERKRLPVCYYLYSLQGAIQGRDWRSLTQSEKNTLLAEVDNSNTHKQFI